LAQEQDAIAARWLAELKNEGKWAASFAATTDDQWDELVADARREMEAAPKVETRD